jgi:hypothetical protein
MRYFFFPQVLLPYQRIFTTRSSAPVIERRIEKYKTMSTRRVLSEDWSEYDNRKVRGGSDHRKFSCSESWEVDYLVNKIHKLHPSVSKETIKAAITACCNTPGLSREREAFVECVMKRLGLH